MFNTSGVETPDVASFRKTMGGVGKGQIIRLLVQRGSHLSYTTLKVE